MIAIRLREGRGRFGVVGHVGVGHVHSHSGFVQDDSAGFAVAAGLLKRAMPVDTTIACAEADVDANTITVTTRGGGTATLSPGPMARRKESRTARAQAPWSVTGTSPTPWPYRRPKVSRATFWE